VPLSIGTKLIGKYTITKFIAAGGFGVVYLAKEGLSGDVFAIKEYFPSQFCNRLNTGKIALKNKDEFHQTMFYKGLERFGTEARHLHKMHHENIIKVTEYFEENNTAYMVMAYIEGMSLKGFLKRQSTLTSEQADKILMPLIDALRYVHTFDEGTLHRDIKPDNILIDLNKGKPILIDFGTTMGVGDSEATAFASPNYSAIEQSAEILTDMQGFHTDIYALAATFYHCLTGEKPLDASARLLKVDEVNLSDTLAGKYDKRLLKLIDLGLIIRPEQRPQSVDELLEQAGYTVNNPEPVIAVEPEFQRVHVPEKKLSTEGDEKKSSRLLIFFLVLFAFGGVGYGAYYFIPTKVEALSVRFSVKPEAAVWKINGRKINKKINFVMLPDRSYKIEVAAENYESVSFKMKLNENGLLRIPSSLRKLVKNVIIKNKNNFDLTLKEKTFNLSFTSNAVDTTYNIKGAPFYKPGMELGTGSYIVNATSSEMNKTMTREIKISQKNSDKSQFHFDFVPNLVPVRIRIMPRSLENKAWIKFIGETTQPTIPYRLEKRKYRVQITVKGYQRKTINIDVAKKTAFDVYLIPTAVAVAEPEPVETITLNKLRLPKTVQSLVDNMISIPATTYKLGCNKAIDKCDKDERADISIKLENYDITQSEINNGLWKLCHVQKGCKHLASSTGDAQLPVTNLSLEDIKEFSLWISKLTSQTYRLPSEAEWEAAAISFEQGIKNNLCRYVNFADSSSPYPWKDSQCNDKTAQGPAKVTSMAASNGLYHMLGNVWEFTSTCWDANIATEISNSCLKATVKGGAFNNVPWRTRASYRSFVGPDLRDSNLGFRLVRVGE
jgi:serine/threonine protein kinase/formylglycine-generating enzyme required for sulfatase activity